MATLAKFEIDASPAAVQRIIPQSRSERFEGVDFSPSGDTLAIAVPWTPSEPGSHLVKVLVDPYGEPDDEDLENNWREIRVSVR